MTGKDLIATLEDFSGGLNWLEEIPAPNEFKALEGYDNYGRFLKGISGRTLVHTDTAANTYVKAAAYYKEGSEGALNEYALMVASDVLKSMKVSGNGASTATTWEWNEILDLDAAAVSIGSDKCTQAEILRVHDKTLVFLGGGTIPNGKNVVLEHDVTATADFVAREMGITAPTINPSITVTNGTGLATGKYRYRNTWMRKDANGVILSESGGNIAASPDAYYKEANVTNAATGTILVSITASSSDTQVTHARVYRTLDISDADNDPNLYYKLVDIATSGGVPLQSFIDKITDEGLFNQSAQTILFNEYNVPIPACKHACYSKGRVFASDGEYIYFTSGVHDQAGLETYDVRYDFLRPKLNDGLDVTGLKAYNGNVIVFKDNKTGVIVNSDPNNGIIWKDATIGTKYKGSITETPWGIMALTNKGVMVHDGVSWNGTDLSEKVVKQVGDDGTIRITPNSIPYDNGDVNVRGYFFRGKYYLTIEGKIESQHSFSEFNLAYSPNTGWCTMPSAYNPDWVIRYDNDKAAVGLYNNATNCVFQMFTGTTNNGSAITGVVQPGYVRAQDGYLEQAGVKVMTETSYAASLYVKIPDNAHCAATDVLPATNSKMNREVVAYMPGEVFGSYLAYKLKGQVDYNTEVRGMKVYGRSVDDYTYDGKFTTGLLARYNMEDSSLTATLADVSGNARHITFTTGGGATLSTVDGGTRAANLIRIANAGNDTATGLVYSGGVPALSNDGEWTVGMRLLCYDAAATVAIMKHTQGSQNMNIIWDGADGSLHVAVGTKCYTFAAGHELSDNTLYDIFIKYKYLTGTYNVDLDFDVSLFVDGTEYAKSTGTLDAGTSSNGLDVLMFGENHLWQLDELRMYDRMLKDEEIKAITTEYLKGDETKQEFY